VLIEEEIAVNSNSCYLFAIIDNGQDGMPGGYYTLETTDNTLIKQLDGGDIDVIDVVPFGVNVLLENKDVQKGLNATVLYPNPANNILNIATTDAANTPEGYTIYNSLGQVIDSGKINTALQSLDIAGYANGVYFVKLAKGSASKTLQFIKY